MNPHRFVLTLPGDLPVQLRVALAREYLGALVRTDELLLAYKLVPPLYETRVRYRQEPEDSEAEEFADALTCLRRGWGDCDDLAAWRCADLIRSGVSASLAFKAHARERGERRVVHCIVRLPDGSLEDPSRRMFEKERRER